MQTYHHIQKYVYASFCTHRKMYTEEELITHYTYSIWFLIIFVLAS